MTSFSLDNKFALRRNLLALASGHKCSEDGRGRFIRNVCNNVTFHATANFKIFVVINRLSFHKVSFAQTNGLQNTFRLSICAVRTISRASHGYNKFVLTNFCHVTASFSALEVSRRVDTGCQQIIHLSRKTQSNGGQEYYDASIRKELTKKTHKLTCNLMECVFTRVRNQTRSQGQENTRNLLNVVTKIQLHVTYDSVQTRMWTYRRVTNTPCYLRGQNKHNMKTLSIH